MAKTIGRIGFVLKGTWDTNTPYDPLDIVVHEGSGYAAAVANQGVEPGSSGDTSWRLLVSKGDKGDPGDYTWSQVTAYVNQAIMDLISPVEVTFSSVSSLPQTVSNAKITSNHKLVYCDVSNANAFSSLTVTPSNGSVTISGTHISGLSSNVITRWQLFQ